MTKQDLLSRKKEIETELESIKFHLGRTLTTKPADLSLILKVVSEVSGVSESDIVKKGRSQVSVRPRHCFMYIAKKVYGYTLKEIGRSLSDRDHTTVINGVTKYSNYLEMPKMSPLQAQMYYDAIKKLEITNQV
jgi:chromosomal replication initiation ATPase DnaA